MGKRGQRRRTIADIEGVHIKPSTEKLPIALAELEADAGIGVSDDPAEMIWTGGAKRIDLEGLLESDLGARTSLDRILMAIIAAYPEIELPRRGDALKRKDEAQYRLEQAKKYLLGVKAPRGNIPKEYESDLDRVARRFYLAAMGFADHEKSLRDIIVSEVATAEQQATLDHKQLDTLIRSHLREFRKHKDRLLVKASSAGLPEVTERSRRIACVIDSLKVLGVIPDRPDKS